MKDNIECKQCKTFYKISYCLVKSLSNRKAKFILPCGHTEVRGNINFTDLLKLFR